MFTDLSAHSYIERAADGKSAVSVYADDRRLSGASGSASAGGNSARQLNRMVSSLAWARS